MSQSPKRIYYAHCSSCSCCCHLLLFMFEGCAKESAIISSSLPSHPHSRAFSQLSLRVVAFINRCIRKDLTIFSLIMPNDIPRNTFYWFNCLFSLLVCVCACVCIGLCVCLPVTCISLCPCAAYDFYLHFALIIVLCRCSLIYQLKQLHISNYSMETMITRKHR